VLSKSDEPEPVVTEEEKAGLTDEAENEDDEDDHDQQDEVIERSLFANIDESDVSDDEEDEGETKEKKKSNTTLRSPQVGQQKGGAGASPTEDEDEDDGFMPSILAGATKRKTKVVVKGKANSKKRVPVSTTILPTADTSEE
jgi:hypothetical protein